MQKQRFRLRNNFILNILFSFSSFVLALFGFLAVLPPASEPEASAIIDGEQFALTVTNSEAINLEINPTESGSIAVAKDTIIANTNSPAGYKLYVSTDSESNAIHLNGHESNDTEDKKIVAASGTFETPLALNQNESSWGFALAGMGNFDASYDVVNPSAAAKFAAVPQKDAEQLIHDHSGRATDDETEIYFAAKANTNISSGNYTTTILYTTLSEATDQDTTEINLDKTIFTTNYEGANKTVVVNTSIVSSKNPTVIVKIGTVSVENLVITNTAPLSFTFDLPAGLDGVYDITLNITNLAKSYTKQKAIGVYKPMQEMTPEFCESMTLEEQKQFIDLRDNKIYWGAKLKDGNCWMTQNLDLDLSTTTTLTPADSDVTTNWTPSRTTITGAANLNSTNWANNYNNPYSFDPGNYYFDGTYHDPTTCNYLTTTCDHFAATPYDLNGEHGHVGNYYNWSAAVASNNTSAATIAGTDVETSICPKGWRLPHGNQSANANDSEKLYIAYNKNTDSDSILLANPIYFVRGGYVSNGDMNGYYSSYWTSTVNSDIFAGEFYNINPFNAGRRYNGISVRCLAHGAEKTLTIKDAANDSVIATYNFETTYKLPEVQKEGYNLLGYTEDKTATEPTYNVGDIITEPKTLYAIYKRPLFNMQDVATWKNYLNLEEQVQVKDTRDNKIYWVAKLKDGNIWMTQNLDYDLSVAENQTLTPATSNVTENRTVTPVNTDLATFSTDTNSIYYLDGGDTYYANGTTKTEGYSSLPEDSTKRHYAQGDYYSWKAATAGQGTTSITNVDVNESICPSGWRLPTSNSADANYSFGNLVKQYGYSGEHQWSEVTDAALLASPLFFARGGIVDPGSLDDQGSYGYYWSSRADSFSLGTYNFAFSSSFVRPSGGNVRYYGSSVRCVAL